MITTAHDPMADFELWRANLPRPMAPLAIRAHERAARTKLAYAYRALLAKQAAERATLERRQRDERAAARTLVRQTRRTRTPTNGLESHNGVTDGHLRGSDPASANGHYAS